MKYLKDIEFSAAPQSVAQDDFTLLEKRAYYLKPSIDPSTGLPTTSSGPPATGTWELDELWIDVDRAIWRCTVPGTPGTWVKIANPTANAVTAGYYAKSGGTSLEDGAIATLSAPNHGVEVQDPLLAIAFRSNVQAEALVTDDQTITVGAGRIVISSNSPVASNRTFHLSDSYAGLGYDDGFQVQLIWSGANAGELLATDSNVILSADWRPASGEMLALFWDISAARWREQWRYPSGGGVPGVGSPSAEVSLDGPVAGSATTAMRSDAAPALAPSADLLFHYWNFR